jgi:hypothetical protein
MISHPCGMNSSFELPDSSPNFTIKNDYILKLANRFLREDCDASPARL